MSVTIFDVLMTNLFWRHADAGYENDQHIEHVINKVRHQQRIVTKIRL